MSRYAIFLVMASLAQAAAPAWAQDVAPLPPVPPPPGPPTAVEGRAVDPERPPAPGPPPAVEGRAVDPERPPPVETPASAHGVSVGRVGAEVLGVSLGVLPALLGTVAVIGVERCHPATLRDSCEVPAWSIAGATLYGVSALLATVGVYAAGKFMRGTGRSVWTLVGAILGTTAGFLAGNAIWQNEGYEGLGLGVFFTVQATGAVLAYELTSDDNHVWRTEASAGWTPTFALARNGKGGVVGARGTF